jgi:hypothetical protein
VDDSLDPSGNPSGPFRWSKPSPSTDEFTLCCSILASSPVSNRGTNDKVFRYELEAVRIAWTLTLSPDLIGRDRWIAVDYLSTLSDGAIPHSGISFFNDLVETVIRAWLELCDDIDLHLTMCVSID